MVNLNGGYRNSLRYWLTCIIGFCAILVIIVVGGFYMVKPYLDSFVKQEIARHSIKAEKSDVSITGKVNLKNVTLPIPADISLKIGAISARPPLSFIPGTFTLYNVDLQHNNIHLQIPKISLNSVSLKKKDSTITSHVLQSIMRLELSSIAAPNILLSVENKNKLTEKFEIKGFQLSDFKNGHIGSVGIQNLDLTTIAANGTKQRTLIAKSNTIKAHDININYAYSIIFGKSDAFNQGKTVTGLISLENFMVNVFEEKEKNTSFSLGNFKTSGLKMKPLKQAPEKLVKAYFNARKANNQEAEKIARNGIILNTLLAITSADAKIDNITIDIPQLKATIESFQFKPSQWDQPIPKKLLLSLDNLSIVPRKMNEKDLEFLKNMDFERLDLSGKLDISYDEKKQTLLLNPMSFNIKNIGSGEISAKAIDVDTKLFSGQKEAMVAVSQDFGIIEIEVSYTDAGFIDKLFSYLAQNLNDSKHDLKKELYNDFYLIMTQTPKILLKTHEKAENISKSFGDFAKNPQTLIVKITAKDKKGLTMADLKTALENGLSTVLDKINLTVKSASSP
ncbi:hypothetical protein [Bartonella quintana]|uniref:AsmA domain-containing protein n=1 Tax=Bartonella quintana JK 68 TaxID=1134503 RepID=A0ABR4SPS5_BARQI|nr:hypothetical protein [Bartonella quintana]ETS13374.1 hypothetical protein Q651_00328 [Bartonella quintana BQ2-D70]ETS17659.1 hypothetical protein Q647_00586 [Bartonella quintana JK 7]ETS18488.1 hypothetical protein Q648_00175 [Bartonella quintana JK 12]KEC59329.1 hypothetical protein O93_00660 [Bartonella quintana JK 19]KEC62564.1 hypothetical protein O7Y_00601 [Bartonella quintana JK 63]